MFVKKGDKVRVIAGKDKGVEAVVLKLFLKSTKLLSKVLLLLKNIKNQTTKTLKVLS